MKKIPFKARLKAAGIPTQGIETIRVEANPDIALEVTTADTSYLIHINGLIPPTVLETVIRGLQQETDQQRASAIIAQALASSVIGQQVRVVVIREPRP